MGRDSLAGKRFNRAASEGATWVCSAVTQRVKVQWEVKEIPKPKS